MVSPTKSNDTYISLVSVPSSRYIHTTVVKRILVLRLRRMWYQKYWQTIENICNNCFKKDISDHTSYIQAHHINGQRV